MARRVPKTRFGEPKVALVTVAVLLAVILALSGGAAAAFRGLLVFWLVLAAMVAALLVWGAVRRRRFRAGADAHPFRPTGPEPAHEPLRPEVGALEAEGYVVEAFGRNALDEALVVLGHPDGSVATVVTGRVLGRTHKVLVLSSCLDPGREWVLTGAGPMTQLTDAFWGDALAGSPSPQEVVRHHAATRAWFLSQGVAIHVIGRGGATEDVVARIRVAARDMGPAVQVTPLGDRRHRALADMPKAEERLHALRRAAHGPLPVPPPTPWSPRDPSAVPPVPHQGLAAFPGSSDEGGWRPDPG